ncbi:MAG: hypothetical protein QOD75_1014 [Blastocatellia bacterium]|jgi:hypothetical protein|nr:hypothetical protein [Blastocatellia bacterium]
MYLKLATVIAIIGTALHLFFTLFQQFLFAYRPFGATTFQLSRVVTLLDALVFTLSLLIFFVAVLIRLKNGPGTDRAHV